MREHYPDLFAKVDTRAWSLPTADGLHRCERAWVVHSKPVGSGEKTLSYLSRYVYRVALSDRSILGRDSLGRYRIRYRKSGTNQPCTMRLEPQELIRRFLQHVLPSRFRKVRYFGLHHSSKRPTLRLLQAAMALRLGQPMPPTVVASAESIVPTCSACGQPMRFEQRFPPLEAYIALFTHAAHPRGPP